MNAIQANNLSKHFQQRTAVDELSFSIPEGEFFALLGENGAGKTTTIKMLCCLMAPTSGDASLLGDSILSNPAAVKRKINVSPQETAIAPNLTVRENIELIGRIYGLDDRELSTKLDGLLETFGLAERRHERAKTLSGGLQRRLSIAMALVSDPKILFLDEPTLGLDVRARRELWKTILHLKGMVTIVLTTHYMEEAEALADRIGVIHQGKLQALGNVAYLLKKTKTKNLEEAFLKLSDPEVL